MTGIKVTVDLRPMFGPARDQGPRPTCLAFAGSDSHAALRGVWHPLCCEYVYYHSQRRAGLGPDDGSTLASLLDTIKEDGQPFESDWPYSPKVPEPWISPSVARVFRRGNAPHPSAFSDVAQLLDRGIATLIVLALSDAFYRPAAGGLVLPSANEHPDPHRRHAVIAVGYGQVDELPALLIRNSWGQSWGNAGYGWLPKHYVDASLLRVTTLTEEIHVLPDQAAA